MKLKVKRVSDVVADLEITIDQQPTGFVVAVKQLGAEQRDALSRASRRRNAFDEAAWVRASTAAYIDTWRGLTPAILRRLIPTGLEEMPPTDADGTIPYDSELAEGLWEHAWVIPPGGSDAKTFWSEIVAFSNRIEQAEQAAEELRKNSLDGSASTSSASTSRPAVVNVTH